MNLTRAAHSYFSRFERQMMFSALNCRASQLELLSDLLITAGDTAYLRRYAPDGFMGATRGHYSPSVALYEEFRRLIPVVEYSALRESVMKMVDGAENILWPGRCNRFAQSSGTSDGKSKYIPLTKRSLKKCHYRGGTDVVARYLALYPSSRLFDGKSFILGGSYANELDLRKDVKVGDLSASLIDCINPIVNLFRTPPKHVALMSDWNEKLPLLAEITSRQNITNLSGVPSWFMTVLERVLELTGKKTVAEVWPNLEVFFHGGIAFGPYREQYKRLVGNAGMRYMETYNASEGFFAVQTDPSDPAMMLLTDTDVFYELLPVDSLDDTSGAVPLWEAEIGKTYALIITSSNGLWRYLIGDTVKITDTNPVKILITGRTKCFINAFGEEVMVFNTDNALRKACDACRAEVSDYTAAPVFADGGQKGHHRWLIEFSRQPSDIKAFAAELDAALQRENSDYQAKRAGDLFLAPLEITVLPRGSFDRWLAATGKLGGQRKVTRLSNDPSTIDLILKTINS